MKARFLPFIPLLVLASAPVPAAAPQAAPSSAATPAGRAALQQEFSQLQKRMDKLAKRMGQLSGKLALDSPRLYAFRYLTDPDSGMIGLVLDRDPEHHGLKVEALTPGGPAEQAGVRVGDVIVSIDGKPVQEDIRPLDALAGIKAGTRVKLGLLRDGKRHEVTVKAEHRKVPGWTSLMIAHASSSGNLPAQLDALSSNINQWLSGPEGKQWQKAMHDWAGKLAANDANAVYRQLTPWWGLNLASLGPDLGSYFGTQRGALVLSTQSRLYPGLKAGDVITAVDGKRVEQPEDVMRALRGQAAGKVAHLTVRRHGKSLKVDVKAPKAFPFSLPPMPPAPPKPPVPPAPPPPPAPDHSA